MEGKKRLNILILSWRGPGHPHAGGAEYSSHEHCKGWVKAGHKVTLFTSSYPGAKSEENVGGVHIKRAGRQILAVHFLAMLWYLFGKHPEYDIVVDEVHGIPFFTPLYVRKPKLVFIHEVAKEVWSLNPWPYPLNLLPALVGTLFEPLIFRALYKKIPFMTVSSSTKEDLTEWGIPKNNVTVIYNGFNSPNYPKNKKESKKTVIYLGALSKDKGIEDALIAFRNLYESCQNIQFWVVGKGEKHQLEYLKKKVKSLGIERVTKFFGFVGEKEKYALLSKAHILINPSVREGWGFVVIEAASVGVPTVAYNVAGLRDSVVDGKTGLLCDTEPKALASKIQYLLDNKELYQSLSVNCLKWSREFSWERSVNISLKLLETISSSNF